MFHNQIDLNQYCYHYTTYTTALEKILPSKSLRFGLFKYTNDPRESKDWRFAMTALTEPEDDQFFEFNRLYNQYLKNHSKILCMTRDNTEDLLGGRGFAHPRMWAQYAGNHSGVCLMFDKQKLHKIIMGSFKDKGTVMSSNVSYGTVSEAAMQAFHISYDEIILRGLEYMINQHILKFANILYFEKSHDWKDEYEHRWVLLGKNEDHEYVKYEDSLAAIIIGADFPAVYELIIGRYCQNNNVHACRMDWYNGKPVLLPIYSPETSQLFVNNVI